MNTAVLVHFEAKLGPGIIVESSEPVVGFYQVLGVTARDETELINFVRKHLQEHEGGSSLVEIVEMYPPDFEGEERDIADLCGDTTKIGVWYQSGHAYFHESEDDE